MPENTATLIIRRLEENSDHEALTRLAQLDSRSAPPAPLIGAEAEGRLLAAVSVHTGEVLADPFSRTAELRVLLELRASQLRRGDTGRRPVRASQVPARPRAALAGSPAGAEAQLLR